jgi:RHS repeat-associated protein
MVASSGHLSIRAEKLRFELRETGGCGPIFSILRRGRIIEEICMNRIGRSLMVLVAVIGSVPTMAFSQVATGMPPFSSLSGGPDSINEANLNVHWTFPIISKAGRGLPFNYALGFDNSVWKVDGASQSWQPVNGTFGWTRQTEALSGYISYDTIPTPGCGTIYIRWVYHDPNGTAHSFSNVHVSNPACIGYPYASGAVFADDGTGYQLSVDASPSATVYPPSGGIIVPPLQNPSGPAQITDTNGNYIITNDGVSYSDTLGSNVLTGTNSGVAYPQSYTYQGPNGPQTIYVVYSLYTVQTNFGCSGIAEYGPTQVWLLTNINYPDQSSYQISYETTPGYSGNVTTGRLASVALPTGGTISYNYWGGEGAYNGIFCDGTTAAVGRTVNDGSLVAQKSFWIVKNANGTTSTDARTYTPWPNFDETVINFTNGFETQRQVWQGASGAGTLLETVETCYNGAGRPCVSQTSVTSPITEKTVYPTGTYWTAKHDYFLNSYGLVTEADDYNWTSTLPFPAPLRKTLTTYATNLGTIVNRTASVTVEDGNNYILAQTTYNYDEFTNWDTSGYNPPVPNHAVAPQTQRGNLTTVNQWVSGSTYLTKHFFYNDTGTLSLDYDVNGSYVTYNYPSSDPNNTSCSYAFPTSVTLPPANGITLTSSNTYNCTGAAVASTTDPNNNTKSITAWDALWRPTQTKDELNNITNISYTAASASPFSPAAVESTFTFNSGSSTIDTRTRLDGLGRRFIVQRKQSPTSASYDSVETDHDYYGRPWRTSMPYVAGAGAGFPAGTPVTTTTYDALSRPLQVTDAGGGIVNYSYVETDTLVTAGPAPSGESAKSRQYESDALGRLTSVCELTSGTGYGTCGQVQGYNGYFTQYGYDAAGRLLTVTQNAQAAAGSRQTRSFSYDGLGRTLSETNPETGTVSYVYDSDTTCGIYPVGDLVRRVDAMNQHTCYAYDALHREIGRMSYTSGGVAVRGSVFVYDSAALTWTAPPIPMANAKGRLAEAFTCITCGAQPVKITDEGFSYSKRGEITDTYESTPHSIGFYHLIQNYWEDGTPKQLSNLQGMPAITYGGLDGEGRITQVTAGSGINPVNGVSYNNVDPLTSNQPLGALLSMNLGTTTSGQYDTDSFSYDKKTGLLASYTFSVGNPAQTDVGQLTWNANGSLGALAISNGISNTLDSQNCTYAHDDLGRIANTNCTSPPPYFTGNWTQAFSYDPFGNITKSGSVNFQPAYSAASNRIASSGYSYDANGNLLSDGTGGHSYQWDPEGRVVCIDGVVLTYDAMGRNVEQAAGGTCASPGTSYKQVVYGPGGGKRALMNAQTLTKAFVPLPGGATAVYDASGLQYYRHSDWLGSSRLASTPARSLYSETAYAPFGENYAENGTIDRSFTGQNQDTVPGLYDFMFREYNPNQGRWTSPDPAGLGAVSLTNPQSWNRYAYVTNGPMTAVDPLGLNEDSGGGGCPAEFASCDGSGWGFGNFGGGSAGGGGGGGLGSTWNGSLIGPPTWPDLIPRRTAFDVYQAGVDCAFNPGSCEVPKVKADLWVYCAGENTIDYTCAVPDSPITFGGLYNYGWHATAAMLGQAGHLAAPGVKFATYGTLLFFQFAPGALAMDATPEIYHITEPEIIFGDHITGLANPDTFHNLPGMYAKDVLGGTITKIDGGYIQYELPGSINGYDGMYQIGGYWNEITGNFYATHYSFKPF